jgi:hypothetical protein
MIDASIFGENLPKTAIDENRMDILRAYVDLKLTERDGKPVTMRIGRQYLKYGSQHLISPLPWANTYRNWEGVKIHSPGDVWDVDGFITRPVNWATTLNAAGMRPTSRDEADYSQTFSGVWGTYHGIENNLVDLYWMWRREQEPVANRMDGSRHTVGIRWEGSHAINDCCCDPIRTWGWDVEGAYQFGHDNDLAGVEQNVSAGFLSAILSHTWNQATWTPALQGSFWWGSGDNDPTNGDITTVDTTFPFGHYYWGLIDNFNGQNLIDYSIQGTVKPTEKLRLLSALHWFNQAQGGDRIYNVAGVALGPGGTGDNLGQEVDLVATYAVHENLSVECGYFWFWYGSAVTNGPLLRGDARQFYVMSTLTY